MSQPAQSTDSQTNAWRQGLGVDDGIESKLKKAGFPSGQRDSHIKRIQSFATGSQVGPNAYFCPIHLVSELEKLKPEWKGDELSVKGRQIILWIVGIVSDHNLQFLGQAGPKTFSISVDPFNESMLADAKSFLENLQDGKYDESTFSNSAIKAERSLADASKGFTDIFDARLGYSNETKKKKFEKGIKKGDIVLVEALLSGPAKGHEEQGNKSAPPPAGTSAGTAGKDSKERPPPGVVVTSTPDSQTPSNLKKGANTLQPEPVPSSSAESQGSRDAPGGDEKQQRPAEDASPRLKSNLTFKLVDIILLADNPK